MDNITKIYEKDKNFERELGIVFAEDDHFYGEDKFAKKYKELNFKRHCEINFCMMVANDFNDINMLVIDNLLQAKSFNSKIGA